MSEVDDFLKHFGVKGMRWGVRRGVGTPRAAHPDAATARTLQAKVHKGNTSALSNTELHSLVTRLNLESQYSRLSPKQVSAGEAILREILGVGGNVAKQQATRYANEYASKGLEELLKRSAA